MRRFAGLAVALLGGCRLDAAPPSAAPVVVATAGPVASAPPVSSAAPSSESSSPCAAVLADNRRVLQPFTHRLATEAFPRHEEFLRALTACFPAGRGAWAIALVAMAPAEHDERQIVGTWALSYVTPEGSIQRACDAPPPGPDPWAMRGLRAR